MPRTKVPPPFQEYLEALRELEARGVGHEDGTRIAFQNLLDRAGKPRDLKVVAAQRERTPDGRTIIVDGELRDSFNLVHGIWEAKRPGADLGRELEKKLDDGYPVDNLLIENTQHAILLQNGQVQGTFELRDWRQAESVVERFTSFQHSDIAQFYAAADEFNARIPQLAAGLKSIIDRQKRENLRFRQALEDFLELCRSSVNRATRMEDVEDMLRQHLMTKRIFESVFRNPDFVTRNPVAKALQGVVDELTARHFSSNDLLDSVSWFYVAIEAAARTIPDYDQKQQFLHSVYERFFQRVSTRTADTHGIVYTPVEIVRWIVRTVDEVLKNEFAASLGDSDVHILDPCTGTGKFVQELVRQLPRETLHLKYARELHCNEVLLLPYYIAAQNIEHEYFVRTGSYEPFPGICFADTLEMAQTQFTFFVPDNTARMQAQEDARITVILGNPPYNVGQQSENDNNRNREYGMVDKRIKDTYGRASSASSIAKLYDIYVRFFRWASDRLRGEDGVVCFVTNSGYLTKGVFDGMRRELLREFTDIYVLDLGGDVRDNPRLSGTRHNVFGITVGVAITLLVRRRGEVGLRPAQLHYSRVGEYWTKREKLDHLLSHPDYLAIPWTTPEPDERGNWLTAGLGAGFDAFMPLGSKQAKQGKAGAANSVFQTFSLGVNTNRDAWVYGFSRDLLLRKVALLVDTYNGDLGRWMANGRPTDPREVAGLVTNDETRIKWSSRLKEHLVRGTPGKVHPDRVRRAMYRPFASQLLYFERLLIHRPGHFEGIYPTPESERENLTLCVTDAGSEKPFMVLATDRLTDLHLVGAGAGTQCFPLNLYDTEGRATENVSREALAQYRRRYGRHVSARDIFDYVYAVLHSGEYRSRFGENLKRELPRIPFVSPEDFPRWTEAGRELVDLHVGYARVRPYPLEECFSRNPMSYRVERMKLSAGKDEIMVNRSLTLRGIPVEVFRYELAGRSALEWVLNQYQVKRDARSGIVNDPNDPDDPQAIVQLVKKVVTVSLETLLVIDSLPPLMIVG